MKRLAVITPVCCGPGTPPIARSDAEALADRFKALADPTRVGIINRLAGAAEVCVCDLTAAFDLSQPTISHHLRVLRDVGLVTAAKRGTWSYYRLVPDAVEPLRIALGARPPDGSAQS
jgi:ArsR family transcriptional regulator